MLHANQAQGKPGQGLLAQGRGQGQGQGLLPPLPPPPPVPESREVLDGLVAKRQELENQLEGMTDRREELSDQLSDAPPAARAGLEERIHLLDNRSARLEREMLLIDDAIAAGLAKGLQISEQEGTGTTVEVVESEIFSETAINVMIGEALAFVLMGIFLYRWTWRRARERFSGSAPNDPARMDQLQNAVDAIALEVERISEGQRYVTKVLNAGAQPDFVAGAGQEQEGVPARRKGS
jgi:chaperonin cofactor prefoldin